MTAQLLDIAAAQDALARSDDGDTPLPGDTALIDAYEQYCQNAQDDYERAEYERQQQEWFAEQCPDCVEGGTGELCDQHYTETQP